jgi:hypothetical protein
MEFTIANLRLKLDALLGANSCVEGVLDFGHFSDEIGGLD